MMLASSRKAWGLFLLFGFYALGRFLYQGGSHGSVQRGRVNQSLSEQGHVGDESKFQPNETIMDKCYVGTAASKDLVRALVMPRVKDDDISWVLKRFNGMQLAIYSANDIAAELHPPRNKGNEAMTYLTYIIDHYDKLPDIIIFMHAHRHALHNIDLLGYDAAEMLQRLHGEHVLQQGYFNMRCRWSPGCPEWLLPSGGREVLNKQEELILAESWQELFPRRRVPSTLAQACCAQFAVSKARIHSIPKSSFVYHRDWIMKTPLTDYMSGRIWEYSWQFLFTERNVFCPEEHTCYCDGYGICFAGSNEYTVFRKLQRHQTNKMSHDVQASQGPFENGTEITPLDNPESKEMMANASLSMARQGPIAMLEEAIERGKDSTNQALQCQLD